MAYTCETKGYKTENICLEEAKEKAGHYPYLLAHMMSEVLFGKNAVDNLVWEELLDARFFSENEELHIFRCEGEWMAVVATDTDDGNPDDILTLTYPVAGKFRGAGRELAVRQYLSADEDGQMIVNLTRLCGIMQEGL
ncbi:MAG: hypothetical protein LUE14_05885 [Clostridiales bacterium]|nr:hypothetical protein [Clostridiales bacterium]